jgi:hypothetical protein
MTADVLRVRDARAEGELDAFFDACRSSRWVVLRHDDPLHEDTVCVFRTRADRGRTRCS